MKLVEGNAAGGESTSLSAPSMGDILAPPPSGPKLREPGGLLPCTLSSPGGGDCWLRCIGGGARTARDCLVASRTLSLCGDTELKLQTAETETGASATVACASGRGITSAPRAGEIRTDRLKPKRAAFCAGECRVTASPLPSVLSGVYNGVDAS